MTASSQNIRLPNSSDHNILNYYVSGTVEQESNKAPRKTKDELKEGIMTALANLNKGTVEKACINAEVVWWPR